MLPTREHLIACIEAFCQARNVASATLSSWILGDGKALPRVVRGGSITIRNYARCLLWLSSNWPSDAIWPEGVERPKPLPELVDTRAETRRASQPDAAPERAA